MINYPILKAEDTPEHIAAGIGLASRQEIRGLIALLEASRSAEILKGIARSAQRKIGAGNSTETSRLRQLGQGLLDGPRSTDALRNQLWFEIKQSLDFPGLFPMSVRGIRMDAAAIGVLAAETLGPSVIAAREASRKANSGMIGKFGQSMRRAIPGHRPATADAAGFPEIVVAELASLAVGLGQAGLAKDLDPEIAAAIRKGQIAMSAAAITGGCWVAFASAVGSAGFAPYIVAAKLSASFHW